MNKPPTKLRQWLWFIGLWAAGVITITLVGLLIRAAIL